MASDTIDNNNQNTNNLKSSNKRVVEYLSENPNDSRAGSEIDDDPPVREIVRSATVMLSNSKAGEGAGKNPGTGLWFDVVAFFFFGMSGWWVYNSLYMESPIFVECKNKTVSSYTIGNLGNSTNKVRYTCTLPEGDNITNQMSILSQLGNVFPFAYRLLGRFCGPRRIRLPVVIGTWLVIGCASAVVAAFFWQNHFRLFDAIDSSVPLLAATLFSGGLGCISSMTYWQFAADFDISHTKALSIGMATGGLFPAIMSLAQNTGLDLTSSSNFTPKVQMLIAAGVQVLFILAFCRIAYLYYNLPDAVEQTPKAKTESKPTDVDSKPKQELRSPLLDDDSEAARQAPSTACDASEGLVTEEVVGERDKEVERDDASESEAPANGKPRLCRAGCFSYVPYTTIFVLYLCTYALPSLAPYMITNYDAATSKSIYTIMNLGYSLGDVLGRVAATFIPCVPSWSALLGISVGVVAIFMFQLFAAVANQFVDCVVLPQQWGYTFVAVQFCYYSLRGYIVTNMYVRVKTDFARSRHSKITARMSTIGQVGSFLGSLIPFLILTVFKLVPSNPGSDCSA